MDRNDLTGELMPWSGGPSIHDCGCVWDQTRWHLFMLGDRVSWKHTQRCRYHRLLTGML